MKDQSKYKPMLLRTLYSDHIGVFEYYEYLPAKKQIRHYIVEYNDDTAIKQFKKELSQNQNYLE